ncbi:hypothetical protein [Chitinolyticbacter albus]|uniref:hypothetical protein n=1 Tax=Chitinolyticbacter albus TaxID=2961951 RepID=UPI00210E60AE|nr:hypothetical protein [Chitinolyticbacter albus]
MIRAGDITGLFGSLVSADCIEVLFDSLRTANRPSLTGSDRHAYHDWVLVRRKGIELGFADSEYHNAAPRACWGRGDLILSQTYFYSGLGDIQAYAGELPLGLIFSDGRDATRTKLAAFESSRHSYRNDTWDAEGYRLSVTYTADGQAIDRVACRQMAAPILRAQEMQWPELSALTSAFGEKQSDRAFASLWGDVLDAEKLQEAQSEGEIDFTDTFGATISLVGGAFRSITLHRNRDMESAGWDGALPQGLDFEDDPEALFRKIPDQPVQQSDSALTGHAVWHFADYTLHVLYSNLDNRLLRVKLIAPGTWKCIADGDA